MRPIALAAPREFIADPAESLEDFFGRALGPEGFGPAPTR